MSDAHQALPAEDRPLSDEERLIRACDWSDYRKAYGSDPDPEKHGRDFRLFCAGWDAGRRSGGDRPSPEGREPDDA